MIFRVSRFRDSIHFCFRVLFSVFVFDLSCSWVEGIGFRGFACWAAWVERMSSASWACASFAAASASSAAL